SWLSRFGGGSVGAQLAQSVRRGLGWLSWLSRFGGGSVGAQLAQSVRLGLGWLDAGSVLDWGWLVADRQAS
ncbi:hypothetical protein, partial [Paenibacillus marchantiophytorum]|uniref:hypothetical protein n=1 Tax=Paenibacillus marchantiophytorum TaxID=1619310 RepID=UPI001E2D3656